MIVRLSVMLLYERETLVAVLVVLVVALVLVLVLVTGAGAVAVAVVEAAPASSVRRELFLDCGLPRMNESYSMDLEIVWQ